jgi:hypothetical protein
MATLTRTRTKMRQPTWPRPETILPRLSVKHLISFLPARLHSICLFCFPGVILFILFVEFIDEKQDSCRRLRVPTLSLRSCSTLSAPVPIMKRLVSCSGAVDIFLGGIMERPTFLFGIHCCLIACRNYQVFIVLLDINTNNPKP